MLVSFSTVDLLQDLCTSDSTARASSIVAQDLLQETCTIEALFLDGTELIPLTRGNSQK